MPFDRLVRLVDSWAARNPDTEIIAQIGKADYIPKHFQSQGFMSPADFDRHLESCSALVAHAGTGTIIKALYSGKPLLVLPRLSALGETRNDHQVGTAHHFASRRQILMAKDGDEFLSMLDELERFQPNDLVGAYASPELLQRIGTFIKFGR
jgi:UDP-N-acetylglucosamine transferase subunit ALG13